MASSGWSWIGKYVLVIVVALFLGVLFGNLALFKSATLVNPKLTAALLVKFFAHMTALTLLWILGWQIAEQMRRTSRQLNRVAILVVALATLIITAIGYGVLSNFVNPFISRDVKEVVSWVFILGVFSAAAWFLLALFAGAEDLIAAIRNVFTGKAEISSNASDPA